MNGKYHGFFNGLDCKKYEVRITPSGETQDNYEEVLLAADEPFVVRYETSKTPFDPVRTSTATIKVVNDEYMYDALSQCAQGTKVELLNITDTGNTITEWVGYMTPKIYNAGYDSCWETFDLEAADCVSSLQYIDYQEISGGGVTNIKRIVRQICDSCGALDGFYWACSKKTSGGDIIRPEDLYISEHNFQTNDTKDYWKLSEVLKELCQYLGFTCLQWRKWLYFVDYQVLEPNNRMSAYKYSKSSTYAFDSDPKNLHNYYEVTADSYMAAGATISMEPVYNKAVVNANMYAIEDFIPNPFDDEFITNRIDSGNTYAAVQIMPHWNNISSDHYKQWYPNGGTMGIDQSWKKEDESDDKYIYYMRPYNHDYWESVYTNKTTGNDETLSESDLAGSAITKDYRGGTLIDLGVVEQEHQSENNPSQWIIPSKMDYTRYICICEKHTNDHNGATSTDKGANKVVYKLKDGYRSKARIDDKCFLVLNCTCIFERYDDCNYINPDWVNAPQKKRGTEAGSWHDSIPKPKFRIQIGDKCWSTTKNKWITAGSLTPSDNYCTPTMKWDEDNYGYWNKDLEILNNVSWAEKVNADGMKIPLSGVDTTAEIEFEIINPDPTFYGNTGYHSLGTSYEHKWYDMNSYCWMKDLSLKVVREGESDLGNDSDVLYENVICGCSVNELSEIKVKVTTFTEKVRPSYSHMLYGSGFLHTVLEESLWATPQDYTYQRPEENIITKYVHQYSTPTKKMTLPLPIDIDPFQKLYGVNVEDLNEGYVQLGTDMDFRMAMQTITAVQKNK